MVLYKCLKRSHFNYPTHVVRVSNALRCKILSDDEGEGSSSDWSLSPFSILKPASHESHEAKVLYICMELCKAQADDPQLSCSVKTLRWISDPIDIGACRPAPRQVSILSMPPCRCLNSYSGVNLIYEIWTAVCISIFASMPLIIFCKYLFLACLNYSFEKKLSMSDKSLVLCAGGVLLFRVVNLCCLDVVSILRIFTS